jgi:hypothetical protein
VLDLLEILKRASPDAVFSFDRHLGEHLRDINVHRRK